ncbi:Hypothetical protein Tpal_489 [Trichococcus palustris]|uniref:Uncharacterized protein n=1 Tax=Trichococcus palustris TaxID=140314 RepID=A0A143Y7H2_9LACT|nr:hypothetical protein [Trichococcus palustris]CZQ83803.1 Hypothetical protein Tpal_489 [Trichococcus palustris]SFK70603.1 hypothetical protein SAMN04488076_103198 [Trichococcus palustris]
MSDRNTQSGLPPEKDYWSIVRTAFEDDVMNNGFQMTLNNGIYDIFECGFLIYTLDGNKLIYKKRYYCKFVDDDRTAVLEKILYKHFGWGGPGSSLISEKIIS